MKRFILLGIVALGLLPLTSFASQKGVNPPNIIVIVTDDHGYADFGAYEGSSPDLKTPHLDALAKNGAVVTNGYSTAPQCTPSRAAISTSRYQTRFALDDNDLAPMDINETTIAEKLKDAGYTTGFVGKWHLNPNRLSTLWMKDHYSEGLKQKKVRIPENISRPYFPMSRGYSDYYDGALSTYLRNYDLQGKAIKHQREVDKKTFRVDKQTDAALAFLDKNHNKPFFLHLNYYAPHVPMEVVKKHFDRFPGEMTERRRWGLASLAAIDDGIGAVMESLRKYKIEENTIVFYFADNGAPLKIKKEDLPFNAAGGWSGSLNGELVGEKGMISEGGVRVPYLVYWKGKIPAQVYHKPVSTMDAGATALALAGVTVKKGELDGVDLMPYLSKKNKSNPHEYLYWRFWGQSAIRSEKWKFFELENGVQMLFDMTDPLPERINLIKSHPELAANLQKKLATWRNQQKRPGFIHKFHREAKAFDHYFNFKK
ncbi:iduronate-sulfatase and sulfatase 1 precursor [Lentisphaera araneosa HTCC2155]|uniref:Iduronate-sulfatase and sulfatase 1 n=1 Tax=Lentisphaera araneosa HTCC2155 TaxID=313628 RepID=A6DMY7_9BACT|nr:sulfatase-like hydrolase/transferase [Lentisphaera araneosa]EDM27023.1 iduronate-sulfatase and sulfatase 1 precursor [Lentisphaera araneosa HTCC2155]